MIEYILASSYCHCEFEVDGLLWWRLFCKECVAETWKHASRRGYAKVHWYSSWDQSYLVWRLPEGKLISTGDLIHIRKLSLFCLLSYFIVLDKFLMETIVDLCWLTMHVFLYNQSWHALVSNMSCLLWVINRRIHVQQSKEPAKETVEQKDASLLLQGPPTWQASFLLQLFIRRNKTAHNSNKLNASFIGMDPKLVVNAPEHWVVEGTFWKLVKALSNCLFTATGSLTIEMGS